MSTSLTLSFVGDPLNISLPSTCFVLIIIFILLAELYLYNIDPIMIASDFLLSKRTMQESYIDLVLHDLASSYPSDFSFYPSNYFQTQICLPLLLIHILLNFFIALCIRDQTFFCTLLCPFFSFLLLYFLYLSCTGCS